MRKFAGLLSLLGLTTWSISAAAQDRIPQDVLVRAFQTICPVLVDDFEKASGPLLADLFAKGWRPGPIDSLTKEFVYLDLLNQQEGVFARIMSNDFGSRQYNVCLVSASARFELRDAKRLTDIYPTAEGKPQSTGPAAFTAIWLLPEKKDMTILKLESLPDSATIYYIQASQQVQTGSSP